MKKRSDTGKWEVRWRENGRNRSRSFTVKADAERFELAVRRAREFGGPLDLDRGRETVAEFMERWWRDYAVPTLADNTRDCYARIWERHVRRRLGGYRIRDVTPAVVAALKADLAKDGAGAATIHKALAIVSGMFRQAVIWDRVDRNPVREIKLPRATRQRFVRPLAPVTVEAMRALLLEEEQLRDATLVSVLAYAGLRPEEAREGQQAGWCSRCRAARSGRTSIGATGGSASIARRRRRWGSSGVVPTTFVTLSRRC